MFYLTSIMTKHWFCELRFVWDGHWIWKWDSSSYMGFWGVLVEICSWLWFFELYCEIMSALLVFFQVLECLSELKFLFELHLCSVSCNVVHNFDVAFRIWASNQSICGGISVFISCIIDNKNRGMKISIFNTLTWTQKIKWTHFKFKITCACLNQILLYDKKNCSYNKIFWMKYLWCRFQFFF